MNYVNFSYTYTTWLARIIKGTGTHNFFGNTRHGRSWSGKWERVCEIGTIIDSPRWHNCNFRHFNFFFVIFLSDDVGRSKRPSRDLGRRDSMWGQNSPKKICWTKPLTRWKRGNLFSLSSRDFRFFYKRLLVLYLYYSGIPLFFRGVLWYSQSKKQNMRTKPVHGQIDGSCSE
jgi:hypothetical protein